MKFEYKNLVNPSIEKLNEVGKEEWNAYAVMPHTLCGEPCAVIYLKRELRTRNDDIENKNAALQQME